MAVSTMNGAESGFWSELRRGAHNQMTVIFAILFKDFLAQLGKSRMGLVWVLLDPMARMVVISSLWYMIGRTEIDGVHVTLFIATGIIPYLLIRRCLTKIPMAIQKNKQLFDYQQVKPIDAVISTFILEMSIITVASFVMFFVLAWIFGINLPFPKPLELIGILLLALCFGFGIALLIAVCAVFYDSTIRVISLITRPLIFVSGVLHPMDILPRAVREIMVWNPLLQIIEYVRAFSFGKKPIPELSLTYLGLLTLTSLGVSILVYYVNRFRLIQQ